MGPIVLALHSIVRWLVIVFAVLALVRMFSGWAGRRIWAHADDRVGILFTSMLDLQMLLGLILYFFLSPITASLLNGTGSISSPGVRFFGVEHILMMLVGVVVAHVGRSISKKAPTSSGKFNRAAILYSLAVVIILLAIPWPFSPVSRPWIRLGILGL
jgi:hypothetical protein